MKTVSIIIPALNEEKAITATISAIPQEELALIGYETQILVINNGSTDKTAELATQAGAKVIHIPTKGIGIAMCAGFSKASGSIIATSDGDGTYPLSYLPNLLGTMKELNLDLLTTNRLQFMHNGAMSKRNKFGNKLLSLTLRTLFGRSIQDSQSGMMLIKKELLNKMQLHPTISVPQEIKIEASYYLKSRWAEVPINYYEREGGRPSSGWKMGISNMINLFRKRIKR